MPIENRIEHFLDNDLPHIQRDLTVLNVKMWFVLIMLTITVGAILSPLIGMAIAGAK